MLNGRFLEHALYFVFLIGFDTTRIDKEVFVGYDDLAFPVLLFLFAILFLLLDSLIASIKHCVEVALIRESLLRGLDASLENRFAILLRPIFLALKLRFSLRGLSDIWIAEFIEFGCVWLFKVRVPIGPLAEVIETFLGPPECFTVELCFELHLRLIDQGE